MWRLRLLIYKHPELRRAAVHQISAIAAIVLLAAGFAAAEDLMALSEEGQYPGQALFAKSTAYQRIVVTPAGG